MEERFSRIELPALSPISRKFLEEEAYVDMRLVEKGAHVEGRFEDLKRYVDKLFADMKSYVDMRFEEGGMSTGVWTTTSVPTSVKSGGGLDAMRSVPHIPRRRPQMLAAHIRSNCARRI